MCKTPLNWRKIMKNFDFVSPTKIYFGPDKEKEVGAILAERNAHNVLIVIGKNSVVKSGLLEKVVVSLGQARLSYEILRGVRVNPTFELVEEGLKICRDKKIDYLLAVGGGSVIDTAKCIAANYYYSGDVRDFNLHKATPTKALPLGVIVTIAAAGSELSNSCVLQDDKLGTKFGFNSDLIRPAFAIENPELTYSLPPEQIAYGVVDILMHTLERYFCKSDKYEIADEFALGLIKNVLEVGRLSYINPTNYEYRSAIMLASSLSHNGITSIGKKMIMPVHQLEHALSGKFPNIAHGLGLAVLFPAWCKYYYKYDVEKFALLGERVFDIYSGNKLEDAKSTIDAFEEYFASLNLPNKLSDLGVKEEDIEPLVKLVTNNGTRTVPHHTKAINDEVAREIYYSCL